MDRYWATRERTRYVFFSFPFAFLLVSSVRISSMADLIIIHMTQRKAPSGIAITLDASELEGLSESELKARYAAAGSRGTHEDLSDVVGEEAKRRKTGAFTLSRSHNRFPNVSLSLPLSLSFSAYW